MRKELQYEREKKREKEGERDCWGKQIHCNSSLVIVEIVYGN